MESRIILSQADFSANNIGRYVALSELTKKVLVKQTQYEEGSAESIALNYFLQSLNEGGFIGGDNPLLTCLIIPALANSHDELLYNIAKLDENGYPTNIMSDLEKSSNDKGYAVYEKGGKKVGLSVIYNTSITSEQRGFDTNLFGGETGQKIPSLSTIAYLPRELSTTYRSSILTPRSTNYFINIETKSLSIIHNDGSVNKIGAEVSGFSKGFIGMSYLKETSIIGIADGATVGNSSILGSLSNFTVQTNTKYFEVPYSGAAEDRLATLSLAAFGSYMDSAKMEEFKGYVDTLMIALHVKSNS